MASDLDSSPLPLDHWRFSSLATKDNFPGLEMRMVSTPLIEDSVPPNPLPGLRKTYWINNEFKNKAHASDWVYLTKNLNQADIGRAPPDPDALLLPLLNSSSALPAKETSTTTPAIETDEVMDKEKLDPKASFPDPEFEAVWAQDFNDPNPLPKLRQTSFIF
ncbi:hypothetical protein VKT23_019601 [Stygiomarasmius scandens]|uniref:Uncharacterized protein n=1 Tax=Marasmiellus scandens TaxID=2682957 RepID=A0ABR1IL10_9AGAR